MKPRRDSPEAAAEAVARHPPQTSSRDLFARFARKVAAAIGSPFAFVLAFLVVLGWAVTGPMFGYSETWQLVINTGTTIVTFLVVFLIQSTQNKDAKAVHLKLDELIYVISKARNRLIDAEELSDAELDQLEEEFRKLRSATRGNRSRDHEVSAVRAHK